MDIVQDKAAVSRKKLESPSANQGPSNNEVAVVGLREKSKTWTVKMY